MAQQFENDSQRDIRVTATSKIWGLATGMLAICIPLTAVAKGNPILPLAVITGAAVGTVAVWQPSDKKSPNSTLSPNHLEALEERIANLETIIGTDEVNFQRRRINSTQKISSNRSTLHIPITRLIPLTWRGRHFLYQFSYHFRHVFTCLIRFPFQFSFLALSQPNSERKIF